MTSGQLTCPELERLDERIGDLALTDDCYRREVSIRGDFADGTGVWHRTLAVHNRDERPSAKAYWEW
jgi:hypothetical protein